MTTPDAPFILYGHAWCHLCEDMRAALEPIAERFGVGVCWIDIDEDPALEANYNELVPVLTLDDAELCATSSTSTRFSPRCGRAGRELRKSRKPPGHPVSAKMQGFSPFFSRRAPHM